MINWFIEEIYKFYENPKNQVEFQKWKKAKVAKARINCNERNVDERNVELEEFKGANIYE